MVRKKHMSNTIIRYPVFVENSALNNMMCFDGGIDHSNIFIREEEGTDGLMEYCFPTISLVPPDETGCYIKIYYNGNILEDTIYIPNNGPIHSYSEKWKIGKNKQYLPSFYDFTISKSAAANVNKGKQ